MKNSSDILRIIRNPYLSVTLAPEYRNKNNYEWLIAEFFDLKNINIFNFVIYKTNYF